MPLQFETDQERAALTESWGDTASIAGRALHGLYDEPQAEDLLMQGTAPTFQSSLSELQRVSVTLGTTIDSVTTFDRRTRGPFTVVRWNVIEDGAFILLGLQQQ